jgi:hypothetical protein
MKSTILCSIILASCLLTGCTENSRTNQFGGDMKIDLPPGEVLENITWKSVGGSTSSANLWILTRKREAGEKPKTHIFHEKSTYGLVEGTVTITER